MLWLSERNFVLCREENENKQRKPQKKNKPKKVGKIRKITRRHQGISLGEAHPKLAVAAVTAHAWLLWEWLDPQALDSALSCCPVQAELLLCGISIQTSRNVRHFKAVAALFLALPNVKLGACSIFGNFCVGGSKERIKKIPLAVKLRAHLGILFLEFQEAFLA